MNSPSKTKTLDFEETQRITNWWIWLALLGLLLFFVYVFLQQVVLGVPVGDRPISNGVLILALVIVVAVLTTLLALQLRTKVTEDGVKINFSLFGTYYFKWHEINKVSLTNVGLMGYGYRESKEHGTVFNLGGKMGLGISLKNGKTYTVLIENSQALRQTLHQLKKL